MVAASVSGHDGLRVFPGALGSSRAPGAGGVGVGSKHRPGPWPPAATLLGGVVRSGHSSQMSSRSRSHRPVLPSSVCPLLSPEVQDLSFSYSKFSLTLRFIYRLLILPHLSAYFSSEPHDFNY